MAQRQPDHDDERKSSVPSSPAGADSVAARLSRAELLARLRLHGTRMALVAALVLVAGAAASVVLSWVGTSSCHDDEHGDAICVDTTWYPLTLQRRAELTTKNGVPHGQRTDWYANGEVWLTGRYEAGARVGEWQERWYDGTLRFSGTYQGDKLHGTESWWYEGGQIEWQVERRHGVRHGQEIWWHANGNKRRVGLYKDGERHGVFSIFHLDGSPSLSVEYDNGAHVQGEARAEPPVDLKG